MTLIIVLLLIASYLLIATGHLTGVNKAAIAMFLGTAGWVFYVCYGTDFVMQQYPNDYLGYLSGAEPTSETVKFFIYDHIFLNYVGKAAAIVMFLLATMSIIELLNNNGCFDFITEWIRTRNSKRLLWTITLATFILSANLDNLTTTTMMLVIMHNIVQSGRQRMLVGSAIVLSATCGGCFTVIGDPTGLILWGDGAVTATHFSAYLVVPALLAWIVPTIFINYQLPDRLDCEWSTSPYRGDDTRLNRWQRLVMLFVGIGGLWFIPTFHNITKLSPFLGALCVLSVLWVVNELFNRKLMNVDKMVERRMPRVLQYGAQQMILYVMGFMLAVGVVQETGAVHWLADVIDNNLHNCWVMGVVAGSISSVLDNFASSLSFFSLYPVADGATGYMANFAQNGIYWKVIAYSSALAGNIVAIGSMSGVALLKMERMPLTWYLAHVGWKALAGWFAGLLVMALVLLAF